MLERLLALIPKPLKMLESPAAGDSRNIYRGGGNARIAGGGDGISCAAADGSFRVVVEADLDLVEGAGIGRIQAEVPGNAAGGEAGQGKAVAEGSKRLSSKSSCVTSPEAIRMAAMAA